VVVDGWLDGDPGRLVELGNGAVLPAGVEFPAAPVAP
jgi:hypothetical protein